MKVYFEREDQTNVMQVHKEVCPKKSLSVIYIFDRNRKTRHRMTERDEILPRRPLKNGELSVDVKNTGQIEYELRRER